MGPPESAAVFTIKNLIHVWRAITSAHSHLWPYLQLAINIRPPSFVAEFSVGNQHQLILICGRIYSWQTTLVHPNLWLYLQLAVNISPSYFVIVFTCQCHVKGDCDGRVG
jgi:hypothetical protein